jgi:hypothetical protein
MKIKPNPEYVHLERCAPVSPSGLILNVAPESMDWVVRACDQNEYWFHGVGSKVILVSRANLTRINDTNVLVKAEDIAGVIEE